MVTTKVRRLDLWLAVFLIAAGVTVRVLRHYGWLDLPPNFSPVSAMAMFSAVYLSGRLGVAVPLGLMLLSDALIGFYEPGVMVAVYASFGVSLLLGRWLRRRVSVGRLSAATVAGSVVFFLMTNAAVWKFGHGYAPGMTGLIEAYLAGLPFFRNTILGDVVYTGLTFGLYRVVVVYLQSKYRAADRVAQNG